MSWIYPGVEVLERLEISRKWGKVVAAEESKKAREEARKQRKRIRERLWDLRNPGKRRSYDKGARERIKRWAKANKEKIKAANKRYYQTEHGKMMNRARVARYKARQKAKREKLSTEKTRNPLTD